jgi:hypothetical protein
MTPLRLVAIALIFVIAVGAWFVLGASLEIRTGSQDRALRDEVGGLWGRPQEQKPPRFSGELLKRSGDKKTWPGWNGAMPVTASDIKARFDLDQRRKGLLWYATYAVDFDASYRVKNTHTRAAKTRMTIAFPNPDGLYDGFAVKVDGREIPVRFTGSAAEAEFIVPAGRAVTVRTGYKSQGLDRWAYAPTDGVGSVRDFSLVMTTDFRDVDFPDGAVSPTSKTRVAEGWQLAWKYDSLVSGRTIALDMPKPLNPGPVASRISFFAPVSLLFFFAAMTLNVMTAKARLHPMHFAFLAAGFFAFHLLFAYLADQVAIGWAFAAASLTAVALCVGYLYLLLGKTALLVESAISQFVFLVLFSFSFFYEGYTGLAITIGAIATLASFMAKTGRTDWETVFTYRTPPGGAPFDTGPGADSLIAHNADVLANGTAAG